MIILGVIISLIGIVVYSQGEARSNDINAIMNDFVSSGVVDNGSDTMTLGLVLIGIGVVIGIVGVVLKNMNKQDNE